MSQNPLPVWLIALLGSGGLAGASALVFNLFKQVTDAKDETIRGLGEQKTQLIAVKDDRIKSLERQIEDREELHQREIRALGSEYQRNINRLQYDNERLQQELDATVNVRQLLTKNLEIFKTQGTIEEINPSIYKIEAYLNRWASDQNLLHSCRNSARWVQQQHDVWLEEICNVAVTKYPHEISSDKLNLFREDLSKYLEWLQDSLYYGLIHQFQEYISTPAIDSPFLYRTAFRYLREKDDVGELNSSEATFLREYLDELNTFLQQLTVT